MKALVEFGHLPFFWRYKDIQMRCSKRSIYQTGLGMRGLLSSRISINRNKLTCGARKRHGVGKRRRAGDKAVLSSSRRSVDTYLTLSSIRRKTGQVKISGGGKT